jgi:hypothetical protein
MNIIGCDLTLGQFFILVFILASIAFGVCVINDKLEDIGKKCKKE